MSNEIKKKIKEYLINKYDVNELFQWFEPLKIEYIPEEQNLFIKFPHKFFAQWFLENKINEFSNYIKEIFPSINIKYTDNITSKSYVYEETKEINLDNEIKSPQTPLSSNNFSSFLSNKKNDFPVAAAKEATLNYKNPPYTPFIIYGDSGSGKTYLLETMINSLNSTEKNLFFYGSIEDFVNFMKLFTSNKNLIPKQQCFFIDDAQRLNDSINMQKLCITYFDLLYRNNKSIIITLDALPDSYSNFSKKLVHRLTNGLIVELKKPDLDIRRQFIEKMNLEYNFGLTKDNIINLAQNYYDFRTITGILTRIKAYKLLVNKKNVTLDDILGSTSKKSLVPERIIEIVANFFSVNYEEVIGKKRDKITNKARICAIYLCRNLLGLSLVQLGNIFDKRDHSSIVYLLKKVKTEQVNDKDMNNTLSKLKKMCLIDKK